MKRPKVIMHNSVSLDGSATGFEADLALHYRLAGSMGADIHLTGSGTVLAGTRMFGGVPPEEPRDLKDPKRGPAVPFWAVVDSGGALKGMLHTLRRFELCRDVIAFVSEKTPKSYLRYLEEREYRRHTAGSGRVDLARMLAVLGKEYKARVVFSDAGPLLNARLLRLGLLDEIRLLVHPCLAGKGGLPLFGALGAGRTDLKLLRCEEPAKGYLYLTYGVKKKQENVDA